MSHSPKIFFLTLVHPNPKDAVGMIILQLCSPSARGGGEMSNVSPPADRQAPALGCSLRALSLVVELKYLSAWLPGVAIWQFGCPREVLQAYCLIPLDGPGGPLSLTVLNFVMSTKMQSQLEEPHGTSHCTHAGEVLGPSSKSVTQRQVSDHNFAYLNITYWLVLPF